MSRTPDKILFGFHFVVAILTAYFLWWGLFASPCFEARYLFQLTFLTQETFLGYTLWALTQDYKNIYSEHKKVQRYPDAAYTLLQIILPLTCLVTVGYWPIRLKDANLMLSKEGQNASLILPLFNHGVNIILCLFEIIFFKQKVVKGFLWKVSVIIIGTIVYVSMQYGFQFTTGQYVYPFLHAFTTSQIAAFYSSLAIFTIIVERINTLIILKIHGDNNLKTPTELDTATSAKSKQE